MTRGDGKVKTTLNATAGIKIQQLVGGVWTDKLYADVDGKLYAIDMTAQNLTITNELTVGNIPIEEMIASMNTGNQNQLSGAVMQSSSISASKIKTDELIVGTNITMGPYAVISWDNVSHQPFIPVDAADVGALPVDSARLTYITSTGVYTGRVSAQDVVLGDTSANGSVNFDAGGSYLSFKIEDDVLLGKNLELGYATTPGGTLGTLNKFILHGTLDAHNITINGMPITVTAKFG